MSNKGLFFTLIILLVIFGGAVLLTSNNELLSKLNFLKKNTSQAPRIQVKLSTAEASKISNEEMKKLTLGPGENATEAVLNKYSETINSASVMSEVVDISSCNPTPNVLSFNPKNPITFVNNDSTSHFISIVINNQEIILSRVNAGTENKTVLSILKPGIYSYLCDGQGPAGMFLVQ